MKVILAEKICQEVKNGDLCKKVDVKNRYLVGKMLDIPKYKSCLAKFFLKNVARLTSFPTIPKRRHQLLYFESYDQKEKSNFFARYVISRGQKSWVNWVKKIIFSAFSNNYDPNNNTQQKIQLVL